MTRPRDYTTIIGMRAPIRWLRRVRYKGSDCGGLYDTDTGTISICTARSLSYQATSLLHELIHHATYYPVLSPRDHYTVDELVTDVVGRGLVTLWRQNPAVFAWIAAHLKESGK